eukprot:SAG31_NODE_13142_length_890_cov_1.321113_1_plen_71_part_00
MRSFFRFYSMVQVLVISSVGPELALYERRRKQRVEIDPTGTEPNPAAEGAPSMAGPRAEAHSSGDEIDIC